MIKVSDFPKCIFCEDTMPQPYVGGYLDSDKIVRNRWYYACFNQSCLVRSDFPRYHIAVDWRDAMFEQEYAITDDIYVKVFQEASLIYHMHGAMLTGEIKIPRALWLNPTNIPQTLTKLRTLIMFS